MRAVRFSVALGVLALSPGVSAAELRDPGSVQRVVGGESVAPGEFLEAVALFIDGTRLCGGAVVGANVVLTSAACLDGASDVDVYRGDLMEAEPIPVTEFALHPQFCPTCAFDIYDFAYVVTETSFEPPFAQPVVTADERAEALALGGELTVVGYGDDPAAAAGEEIGIKRKVTVPIHAFSESGFEFTAGGDGRDSCDGDGGAPAFATLSNGRIVLAGLVSRGSVPCGEGGVYGAAFVPLCWIRDETGLQLPTDCPACDCDPAANVPPVEETDTDAQTGDASDVDTDVGAAVGDDDKSGCSCRGAPAPGFIVLLFVPALLRRRLTA